MLLARKIVKDSKGREHSMVVLRVATSDGTLGEVTIPASRYNQLDSAVRAQAYKLPPYMLEKKAWDSSDPIAFYVSQLAYTEATMFEKLRYPALWKELVPVSYEAPPWARTVEYQTFDKTGKGKRIASNGTDIPLVDVALGRRQVQVESGGLGYSYTMDELQASQQLKQPLDALRMSTVIDGVNRHLNDVCLVGENQFSGLLNNSNITPTAATTGAWDTADPLLVLADINKMITGIYEDTGTNDVVTDIGIPIKALSAINTRIVTTTSGGVTVPTPMTIMKFLMENNMSKLLRNVDIKFHGIPDLETAGTLAHDGTPGTSSRVIYYVNNPDRLIMHIPQTLQFLAPQLERLAVVVPAWYRYAGLEIRYVKSVRYQDNVLSTDPAT